VHDGITSGIIAASQTVHQIKWHKSGLCQKKKNPQFKWIVVVWFFGGERVLVEKNDMLFRKCRVLLSSTSTQKMHVQIYKLSFKMK